MSKTSVRWMALVGATLLLYGVGRSASAQAITNGGFEANGGAGFTNFTDWTSENQAGSAGAFFVQTGTGTPLFGNLIPAPPEGSYAAMTDGGGAGSYVLYQDFVVPTGTIQNASLSFQLFVNNQASDFFAPATLDFTIGSANQQARVDLLLASADPFSVASGDVLLTLYQTQSGDALTSGYTAIHADLASLLQAHTGESLRLRFAEADNEDVFNLGVDDVNLSITAVPEPGSVALLLGCVATGGKIASRRRRQARL